MKLSEELQERGFIYQSSAESVGELLDEGSRTVYLGIDPTASSIHVGNLVPYMFLNRLMMSGHKVILLMGGGTALVGDPGGKSEERLFVEPEVVVQQAADMESGIRRFVTGDIMFVNNYEWLSKLSMIEYLRDIGKHFTVNAMIKKDIVANRLTEDNSISYTEFSYSLLQAYDYAHLHKEFGCDLQIGGSDQWSNILAGVDYIRRTTGDEVHALTMPLVVDKATGKKFGKSEGNAVWLNPEKTSPYEFYQFWLNTSDENVIDYLKLFTFLTLEEIGQLEKEQEENPGARAAQKRLAKEVTSFVHTQGVAEAIERVSASLFGDVLLKDLSEDEISILKENAPLTQVSDGATLVEVLVSSELATSNREARTFIEGGGVQISGEKIEVVDALLKKEDLGELVLLKRGKKNVSLIEIV